jgi:hypothetical protein
MWKRFGTGLIEIDIGRAHSVWCMQISMRRHVLECFLSWIAYDPTSERRRVRLTIGKAARVKDQSEC